jgi:hypothetical protein
MTVHRSSDLHPYLQSGAGTFSNLDGIGGDLGVTDDFQVDDLSFFLNTVLVDQNADAIGLNIDSEATTAANTGIRVITGQGAAAAYFQGDAAAGSYTYLNRDPNAASSGTNWFYRDLAAAGTSGPLVGIEQDSATDDQNALNIQNDGTGKGQFIDQNGDATGLEIDSEATTTTNYALKVATGAGAHNALFQESANNSVAFLAASSGVGSSWFYRNLAAASTGGPLVFIEQDEATDDQPALSMSSRMERVLVYI